jgi:glutaredoxin
LFAELNVQVLGISIDHVPVLQAWAEDIGGISYPLVSDFWPHGVVSRKYGVFREDDGFSERAIFIIDKNGIIQYINVFDIDEQPDNEDLFKEISRIQPDIKPSKTVQEEAPEEELELEGIVLFCNKWCPGCRRARMFFADNNIEYREYDVTRNPAASRQVKEWTGGNLTTPTFYINGEVVIDWKVDEVRRLVL